MATQPNLACSEVKSLHKVVLDLLQPVQAVLALQVNLRVLKMVPNDFPYQRIWGLKKVSSMLRSQVTPRSCPWPPTARTGPSDGSENYPKWFPIPKNLGFKKHISYRPFRLFSSFRSIWGLWKWSQMIPYTQKPGVKKNRSVACIEAELLPEVLLDLLQPVQAVLAL